MKVVDLFAGCGGMSLGFAKEGFEIVGSYDNWDKAIETYKKNMPEHYTVKIDLKDFLNEAHPEMVRLKEINPDIIIGGPPCQDFSSAGKRKASGKNGNLTPLFAQIVTILKPNWVVMENVNTIKSIGESQLKKVKELLKNAEYGISTMILNAADFGVPQNRKRFFLIAHKNGEDDEMIEHINRQKKPIKSVREYFIEENLGMGELSHYYRHPRTYTRRAIFSIDEPSPTIRGVNRPVPETYKPHKRDTEKDAEKIRPLTSKERAIIQTFPDDFEFVGGKSEVEQQIGNAVPPILAAAIAKAIKNFNKNIIYAYSSSP